MVIQVNNIAKQYKNSNFKLNNISFQVKEKEIIGLIGPNGSGKSTILKMLNGLISFDSGQILIDSKDITKMNDDELRKMRKSISYIFQNSNLLEGESVYYHLSLIFKLNGEKIDEKKIDEILSFMNIFHLKKEICRNLSGGQQQKVAIAMSILQNPKVLLCDEISSALDVNSEQEIFNLLLKLRDTTNISLVVISHNLSILKNFCDKVIILGDSQIKEVITPKKSLSSNYKQDYFNHVKEFLTND
ncbi:MULTISPECIES: ATP-binding cassette domain-containing protein [unclassified Gemella]|uniref:ATP-binding cassette domain-containing protein n=1 Tax=unclassified Gemella TaxID=2624949 RepID=UPI0010734CB9|nr:MULTISPECIES: ATP-binding cassette domain-containing protein [unclassified Gemella]MBF0710044.1 ATP-binding cassette domain-containing protein [Gemella sp. GL1.1]MBF0746123.1 ATP-binding cassette domain-containing protein [Gemella sp. 19428wG2_WT2a]NYS27388.1 ATP-binding cassette domain-containing protein [Gemella sp. GL1]TFU60412.1 ATP-binding cassette domain-containing protein [Gemella sp. WT2a]